MGVAEVLVHTYDIAQGLDVDWVPPDALSRVVVERLLPDAPDGGAPDVLLWATGRADLDGRSPAGEWAWRTARSQPDVDP